VTGWKWPIATIHFHFSNTVSISLHLISFMPDQIHIFTRRIGVEELKQTKSGIALSTEIRLDP
jgi:hypothetical protein